MKSNLETIKKITNRLLTSIIAIILIFAIIICKRDIISKVNLAMIVISVSLFMILTVWQNKGINNEEKYFQISDFFSMLFSAYFIFQAFFAFGFYKANVDGSSMYSTLSPNQNIIVKSVNKEIKFGDVVVVVFDEDFNNNVNPGYYVENKTLLVKRVIGLPGDSIYCIDNQIYINNVAIDESYLDKGQYTSDFILPDVLKHNKDLDGTSFNIPKDYYLVLGDNRLNSNDSRYLGVFHKSQIVGVVKYKMESNIFDWSEVR